MAKVWSEYTLGISMDTPLSFKKLQNVQPRLCTVHFIGVSLIKVKSYPILLFRIEPNQDIVYKGSNQIKG